MRLLQWTLWGVGLVLQYLVLSALLRGPLREFKVLFLHVFFLLASTVGDIVMLYTVGRPSPFYPKYFWAAELTRQSGVFAVVVSLIMDVIPDGKSRHTIRNLILSGAALFWTMSVILTWSPALNDWMTGVVRNLSFGAAVLDLGLWFALISSRSRDNQRLLIAGGIGLQMTGVAIGQSFRHLFPEYNTALAGSMVIIFSHFVCLIIWWYAFTRERVAAEHL